MQLLSLLTIGKAPVCRHVWVVMTIETDIGLADFAGSWSLHREIEDFRAGNSGRLDGSADFTAISGGLLCTESGTLRLGDQPPLLATRRHIWRAEADGIAVFFEDGRPFHSFVTDRLTPLAEHDCPPDLYGVVYDFSGWPRWRADWQVSGPRKHYRLRSFYQR